MVLQTLRDYLCRGKYVQGHVFRVGFVHWIFSLMLRLREFWKIVTLVPYVLSKE